MFFYRKGLIYSKIKGLKTVQMIKKNIDLLCVENGCYLREKKWHKIFEKFVFITQYLETKTIFLYSFIISPFASYAKLI